MKRWKLYLGLLVLFLSGVVVGVVGSGMYLRANFIRIARGGPQITHQAMLNHLTRKLDLSAEQQKVIGPILWEKQQAFLSIRREIRPKLDVLFEETETKITQHLTEEQREQFTEISEKMKEIRHRWRKAVDR